MNLAMNDVLKMAGQKPLCKDCLEREAMPNTPYCQACRDKMEERNYDNQVKYSNAGRHREAFESNPFRSGKY